MPHSMCPAEASHSIPSTSSYYLLSSLLLMLLVVPCGTLAQNSSAAQTPAPTVASAVPRLIRFASMLRDGEGNPITGTVQVTLRLYKDQTGGVALWQEAQNVAADDSGHYSLLLGATQPEGLPLEIFSSGEARWLGIQAEGQPEQPRILLLSVAYALKAADAETLGGKPLSAFVLAENPSAQSSASDGIAASGSSAQPANPTASNTATPCSAVLSDGTAIGNQIAKFTAPCNIEPSAIFENAGNVGIGNTSPAGTLDVSGTALVRGEFVLTPNGQATTSQGANSNPLDLEAQSYNTALNGGANYIFRWQAEPTGNDTTNTGASLNLLFGVAASMSETGLSINRNGIFTWAPGQTFPGNGTITGVTAGSGLTGGGTSGNVTLGLLTSCSAGQVLAWTGSAWACSSSSGTITGVTAGPGLSGGGTSGNVTIGMPTTCSKNQVLSWTGTAWACSSTGTGTITGVSAGSGLSGGGTSGSVSLGLLSTCATGQVLAWNGTAWACSATGTGTITGVTAGSGLTGGGASGNVSVSLLNSCATGQVLSWNGSAWVCTTNGAGTITGVTAGSGLTGGGTSGNVSMSLLNTCTTGQVLAWNGSSWACSTVASPSGTTNGLAYFASPSTVTSTVAPTNGQILIGSTGKAPTLTTLTAGSNISITNSPGQITISSSGSSLTLPFFTTGGAYIGAGKTAGFTNVNKVWGILLPYNVNTSEITYAVAVADKTSNLYDLGLFSNVGDLIVDLGAVPGTTFAPATGFGTLKWAQGSTILAPGRYYLGFTTNCVTACAQLAVNGSFVSFASNASAGITAGGALPKIMSPPLDIWKGGNQPVTVIH